MQPPKYQVIALLVPRAGALLYAYYQGITEYPS